MLKFGTPDDFFSAQDARLKLIKHSIEQFLIISEELKKEHGSKVTTGTKLYIKGLGNDIRLLSVFRELFLNSRELLDNLLIKLNKITANTKVQTPREFLPFVKKMMANDFDETGLEVIKFLKANIAYVFHVRKIRNELKNNPANVEFIFMTDHFEARLRLPILRDESELLPFLNIENKEEAIKEQSYGCRYNLDILFPEMLNFWNITASVFEKDLSEKK